MMEVFKSKIKDNWNSISIDGSAFDSTQHSELMKLVDNVFWQIAYKDVVEILDFNEFVDPRTSAIAMVKDAQITEHILFVKIPGINLPLPLRYKSAFVQVFGHGDSLDYVALPMRGTTFSGHPTRTTLGNTFRSLMYMYYYLSEAGLTQPWDSKDVFVAAAGDDVVVWCNPDVTDRVVESIRSLTARDRKTDSVVGVGQVVPEVVVGKFWQIDF